VFIAASIELAELTAYFAPISLLYDKTADRQSSEPPIKSANAETSRAYFSMVAGLFSLSRKNSTNPASCFFITVFAAIFFSFAFLYILTQKEEMLCEKKGQKQRRTQLAVK
jgi:hypothetical protein